MTHTQHIHHCGTHPECTVVWFTEDDSGHVSSESHLAAVVHAEHRLNRDYPAVDHRASAELVPVAWSEWCADCIKAVGSL